MGGGVSGGVRHSLSHLVDDVNAVIELLPLQERVHMVEEELQVVFPVSVGDDYGGAMLGLTVWGAIPTSPRNKWVLPLDSRQGQARGEGDADWSAWADRTRRGEKKKKTTTSSLGIAQA